MIRAGRLHHRNFLDLDFLAVEVTRLLDGGFTLYGWWVRRDFGCGEIVFIDRPDTMYVKPEQVKNWHAC